MGRSSTSTLRRALAVGALLLSAAARTSAWTLPIPSPGYSVMAATDDYILVTHQETQSSSPLGTGYNTSTQKMLWNNTQLCFMEGLNAYHFLEIQPGVVRYVCGEGSTSAQSSHTLEIASGRVLSNTSVYIGYWNTQSTPIVNKLTGTYCLPRFPPLCVFANGTAQEPTHDATDYESHYYFSGTTFVVALEEQVFFFDAVTGNYLSYIGKYYEPSGFTSQRPVATVSFVDDLVVLVLVAHTYPTQHAYAVVINITQRAVTAQAQLGSLTYTTYQFLARPVVARRGAELVVGLPVWADSWSHVNCTLHLWEVPTANAAATAPLSAVPTVAVAGTVALAGPAAPPTSEYTYSRQTQCTPVGGFLSCTWLAYVNGGATTSVIAATNMVNVETLSVVSNVTETSVFAVTAAGRAGSMLVVAGSASGIEVSTTDGYETPPSGVAAFDPTTGAMLWAHSGSSVVGSSVAYDSVHECVVVSTATGLSCVTAGGSS